MSSSRFKQRRWTAQELRDEVYLDPDNDYDPDSIENSSNGWGDSSEEEDCTIPSAVNVRDGGFANKDLLSTSTANASSRPTRVSDQRNHLVAIKINCS